MVILLIEQNIASFREYEQSVGARCTQTERFLHGLSAAGNLRCAVVCLATVNCNSFNYYHGNDISTSNNCELVTMTWQEAANDDDALTADADWNFYGSQPLVASGRQASMFLVFSFDKFHDIRWGGGGGRLLARGEYVNHVAASGLR